MTQQNHFFENNNNNNNRAATQEALKKQLSRMDIEFPVGTKFGVEKYPKVKSSSSDGPPTQATLDTSDRELARLFVDMFQPVGGENIVVCFTNEEMADSAKKKWKGDPSASSRIMAMNRRKSSSNNKNKKKTKARGFAAKIAAEVEDSSSGSTAGGPFQLPDGTQVALFVSPGPKELVVIEKICNQVGMGTCVILLNARLSKISNFGTDSAEKLFTKDFQSVFCLSAAPQEDAPNCCLCRWSVR